MATIVYKNAKMFIQDAEIDAQLSELNVDYKAEMLDVTTFGYNTRIKRGGLYTAAINGKGFYDSSTSAESFADVIWSNMGEDNDSRANGAPTVITVFADGITEGTLTDMGFAMLGVVSGMTIGGAVGTILPLAFTTESRCEQY